MRIALAVLFVAISGGLAAQIADPTASRSPAAGAPALDPAALSPFLTQLNETARTTILDIAQLRIDKWKADATIKKQANNNADSISRNVTTALPGMVEQVKTNPQSLTAGFKLYRNLSALNDGLAGLIESAGAFGSKAEFESLSKDGAALDKVRMEMGDALETLAARRDAEIVRLRSDLAQAKSTPPSEPVKKVVVDEDAKPDKPAHKKPAKPQPKPPSQTPPAQTSVPNNTSPQQ